jgi:hypothetical protein
MKLEMAALRREIERQHSTREDPDRWLDAKAAAGYLGICASSFDKYRYSTSPKLNGSKLDGKTLYKKSDLDNFVRLYDLKSRGFA